MKNRRIWLFLVLMFILFFTCVGCQKVNITVPEIQEKEPAWTPLHRAVVKRDLTEIQSLINNNTNIDAKEKEKGQTPLHFAFLLQEEEIIKLLIENGANKKAKDNKGRIPSDLAPP